MTTQRNPIMRPTKPWLLHRVTGDGPVGEPQIFEPYEAVRLFVRVDRFIMVRRADDSLWYAVAAEARHVTDDWQPVPEKTLTGPMTVRFDRYVEPGTFVGERYYPPPADAPRSITCAEWNRRVRGMFYSPLRPIVEGQLAQLERMACTPEDRDLLTEYREAIHDRGSDILLSDEERKRRGDRLVDVDKRVRERLEKLEKQHLANRDVSVQDVAGLLAVADDEGDDDE